MNWELLKEPILWVFSAFFGIAFGVIANIITPKITPILLQFRKPKFEKQYDLACQTMKKVKHLQKQNAERFEQKLDAIHLLLLGIAMYLVSFLVLWLSTFLEPAPLLALGGVIIFFIGTNRIDTGIKLMSEANLALKRNSEILKWIESNDKSDLPQYIEELNKRDFGINSTIK